MKASVLLLLLHFYFVSFVVNSNTQKKLYFFFIITLIFAFRIISVDRVYIYYMSISLYTDFYSRFASPATCICVLFSFFCYSSDYVITIFFFPSGICENVNSTKKKKKRKRAPDRSAKLRKKKKKELLRPAERDNADFNVTLFFVYISQEIL